MKRRILSIITALALCLSLLPAVAWAAGAGDDAVTQPQATAADINMSYNGFVFAQGVSIVIKQNEGITSIYDTDDNLLSGDTDVSSRAIYGGWYDKGNTHTGGTSIVMESGTVQAIFGGSYSDVLDGNTNVVLNGGTVGWVYGGGNQSAVTGTAHVTVNSGARVWGNKRTDPTEEYKGTVFGGGYIGTVSNTEVVFNGGDAGWIYGGGEGGCTCTNTRVRYMGQPDDFMAVSAGGNGGSIQKAVLEFHGYGVLPNNMGIQFYGGGWNDTVEEVQIIIGAKGDPGAAIFCAMNTYADTSTVGSASFEVHWDRDGSTSLMSSSGLDGTGVTGTVTARIFSDAATDVMVGTGLTEIDELIVESGSFTLSFPETLDRLEVKDSGTAVIPAVGGTTRLGTLAGSGTILFAKRKDAETTLPVIVDCIDIPEGSRIKVGSIGGYLSKNWAGTVVFQGPGVEALSSASCFSSKDAGYYLAKTDDGTGIQVKAGTEQKQTVIDPTPTFDRKSYQYGETMHITMGLKSEGEALPGQLLEVRGGVSGTQTFATAETDADGQVSFDLPVDDNLWASRKHGLQAMFHATEGYKESFYGISLKDGNGAMDYIVTGAKVDLADKITAPARGEVPVKTLAVSGSGICAAEVIWSPEDETFRPEVAYTAGIRLVPKQGFSLDGGRLGSVTYQGQALTLPGSTEADGSLIIADVQTYAPIPAIHVNGVTLNKTSISLSVGDSEQLAATIAPSDADNKAVTWTSSNPAVATVNSSGMVTAVGEGTATVTVTAADGSKTADCTVTVKNWVTLPDPPADEDGKTYRLVMDEGIGAVPAELQNAYQTPEALESAMKLKITEAAAGVSEECIAVYDVTLLVSTDGGATWTAATKDNFPTGGLTVTLPYPEGTNSGYVFTVVHMFTTNDFDKTPGDTETPAVTNTSAGIRFTVTGLSPISVGWKEPSNSDSSSGGGSAGSWSAGTYTVNVEKPENGKVSADRSSSAKGNTVTLSVTPDSGYTLDTLTVTDSQGNIIELTDKGGGRYTFVMPGRAVTVKATFADATPKTCDGGADCPSRGFTDLGGVGAWYHEAVDYVLRNRLMDGYGSGTFGPDDNITRAQLAQILYNRAGKPAVTDGGVFTDVPSGVWYANAVAWASAQGIVDGYGDGRFGPGDDITREQLAVMLWRCAGSPYAGMELNFTDADKAGTWALDALRWAVENGVISGYGGGRLDPQGPATRAQAAQMLMNFSEG